MLRPPTLGRLLSPSARTPGRAMLLDLALLTALVCGIYLVRLTELPIMGEEGRRARGAVNMIETGDWIVLKQQGVVFPDRPPMTNWLIAAGALVRGTADVVAIRLPSFVAVLLTTLLLYWVAARVDDRLTAIAAAAAFATFAQVMQLGRLGESEAAFTFFVAASLLTWLLAWGRGRPAAAGWIPGYALAALGALVKGLQAPVYFLGSTGLFLALRRRWRWLLGPGHWAGLAVFVAIVGAWQLPYYRATDRQSVIDTWFGVVGPRLGVDGLLEHLASYPLETFGCLAPWSFLLLALLHRDVRRRLIDDHPQFTFVVTALAVTYPTVWWSAGAKGRYYMPLYPIAALLVGMIASAIERAAEGGASDRWRRALVAAAPVIAVPLAAALVIGSFVEISPALVQPWGWTVAAVALAAVSIAVYRRARRSRDRSAFRWSILTLAAAIGLAHTTLWVAAFGAIRFDIGPGVRAIREQVPVPERLVSFGPVDPRFAYHYEHFIPEIPWPETIDAVPADVDHFVFDLHRDDTAEARYNWRGMHWWRTPGTLPFLWEEIDRVSVVGKEQRPPKVRVILGRVVRGEDGGLIPADEPIWPGDADRDGRGGADS